MTDRVLRLDAYIRVSKVAGRSGESFISPDVQRERIQAWAIANGAEVTWHEPELDVSGGRMRRPIFDRIMGRIRAGQTGGVIVAKLDRFARTLVGALSTLEELEQHQAVLVSVADNLDLSTPMGKAFLRILLVFAELERDRIGEAWRTASDRAIDRGIHIAKFVPVGYAKAADKRLVPGEEAAAIREAFLMRGAHMTRSEIARRLDRIAPRPNGGRWTPPMVDRIIRNRVYMGHAYRGGRVNGDAHPAIVTAAEWRAANEAPVRAAARGKRPNLLGGLARCAACRYVLAPSRSGRDAEGPRLTYRCRRVHTAGVCPAPATVSGKALEAYVEGQWLSQMQHHVVLASAESSAGQEAAEAVALAEKELALFASDLTARRLLGGRYHDALSARVAAVDAAKKQLDLVDPSGLTTGPVDHYVDLPVVERRRIIGASIDAVIVERAPFGVPLSERVLILWSGEGPDDLPRRGRENGPIRAYIPDREKDDPRLAA